MKKLHPSEKKKKVKYISQPIFVATFLKSSYYFFLPLNGKQSLLFLQILRVYYSYYLSSHPVSPTNARPLSHVVSFCAHKFAPVPTNRFLDQDPHYKPGRLKWRPFLPGLTTWQIKNARDVSKSKFPDLPPLIFA